MEPDNYRSSNTARWKEILDIEITLHRNSGIVIGRTITIFPETSKIYDGIIAQAEGVRTRRFQNLANAHSIRYSS